MRFILKILLLTILSSFLIFGGEGKAIDLEKRSTKIWNNYVYKAQTCGIAGRAVTGFTISGGNYYRVHVKGRCWLPAVKYSDPNDHDNGYAGTYAGDPIDAIAISGGDQYRVHIKGGNWLSWVSGYNINNSNTGYAGIIGKEIDQVQVKGYRLYATSFNA